MKAISLGVLSALFFASTFLLNRLMSLEGGSFAWSASLRFLFMIPPLILFAAWRGNLNVIWGELRNHFWIWFIWGTVGFGLFYTGICFAGDHGPSWLVAGTWQLTIICGPLLAPLFKERIPWKTLRWSVFILIGVMMIQADQAGSVSLRTVFLSAIPLLIAAVAYPLGNRKIMEYTQGSVDTFSRMLLMCLGSLPWWILVSGYGLWDAGWPSSSQVLQSAVVAVCSGIIATSLFFYATSLVAPNQSRLAIIEATQATEVVFALIGEIFLLHGAVPSSLAIWGLGIVSLGIVLQCIHPALAKAKANSSASITN